MFPGVDDLGRSFIFGPGPHLQNPVILNDDFVAEEIIRPYPVKNSTCTNNQASFRSKCTPGQRGFRYRRIVVGEVVERHRPVVSIP